MFDLFIWILLKFLLSPIVLIPTLIIVFLLVFQYKKQLKIHQIQIEAKRIYMEELRQSNIHEIDQMDGRQFEEYLSSLYQSFGYQTEVTKGSGYFGADLILKSKNETIIVQVKRYSNKVSLQAVQEIVAAKSYYSANHAWVVTNNYYTGPARKLADANDVFL
ncbi:restriction endonuclease [Bacillus mycoides]|uniref:restriction endonuclease n=1 Tax=Bacillus mycoides TaxID=1405 RepID=UPI00366DE151